MSVHTTNTISQVILSAAVESAAVACAADFVANPIGLLGGAIFGAVRYISQIPLLILGTKCLNTEDPLASSAAKTLAKALQLFGSYAAAWGVLAAAGVTLTLSHVVTLSFVSGLCAIGVQLLLSCLGLNTEAAGQANLGPRI